MLNVQYAMVLEKLDFIMVNLGIEGSSRLAGVVMAVNHIKRMVGRTEKDGKSSLK